MRKRIAVICGLAFYWPYFRNSYFGFFFATSSGLSYPIVVLFASMVVCGLLIQRHESLLTKLIIGSSRWMLVLAGVTTTLLYIQVFLPSSSVMTYLCALALGAISLIIPASWAFFCIGEEKVLQKTLPLDVALSLFFSFVITSFNVPFATWIPVIYPLFPVTSALFWAWGTNWRGAKSREYFGRTQAREPLIMVGVFVLGVSVVAGIYTTGVSNFSTDHTNVRLILSIASTLMLAIAMGFARNRPRLVLVVWIVAFLYVFAGIMAALIFGENWTDLAADVIIVGRLTIWTLFWLLLTNTAIVDRASPCRLMGLFACFRGASALATDFSSLMNLELGTGLKVVLLVVLLVLLGCAFAFMSQNSGFPQREDKAESLVSMLGRDDSFDRAEVCARIASAYDLTDRESAVLILVSQGNTVKKIAELLFLSESTVRTHTKNLYRKLGCHSKQEVIDFVNEGGTERAK